MLGASAQGAVTLVRVGIKILSASSACCAARRYSRRGFCVGEPLCIGIAPAAGSTVVHGRARARCASTSVSVSCFGAAQRAIYVSPTHHRQRNRRCRANNTSLAILPVASFILHRLQCTIHTFHYCCSSSTFVKELCSRVKALPDGTGDELPQVQVLQAGSSRRCIQHPGRHPHVWHHCVSLVPDR